MKILGVNSGSATTRKSKIKKAGDGGFASHLNGADEASGATSTSSVAEVDPVNSLFMIQEVDSNESPRSKSVKRGQNMVEYLDEIRIGLLAGTISPLLLQNLDGLVKSWRDKVDDPELEALIDEIELRAAVELAKLENDKNI